MPRTPTGVPIIQAKPLPQVLMVVGFVELVLAVASVVAALALWIPPLAVAAVPYTINGLGILKQRRVTGLYFGYVVAVLHMPLSLVALRWVDDVQVASVFLGLGAAYIVTLYQARRSFQ